MISLSSANLGPDQIYHQTILDSIPPILSTTTTEIPTDQILNTSIIESHTPCLTTTTSSSTTTSARTDSSGSSVDANNNIRIVSSTSRFDTDTDTKEGTLTYEELEKRLKVVEGGSSGGVGSGSGGGGGNLLYEFHLPSFVGTAIDAFCATTANLQSSFNSLHTQVNPIQSPHSNPGSRFLALSKAKMQAEEVTESGGDQPRPADVERGQELWERAMPFGTLQEMDRMRHGNTVINTEFAMGGEVNGSKSGETSGFGQSGMEGRESKTSTAAVAPNARSSNFSQESPIASITTSHVGETGWSPATSGTNLQDGRARQMSSEQPFNISPQIRSAPPAQTSFKLESSPTSAPSYRPQSQQSAYFQRMIAAKLASDPSMRPESTPSSSEASAAINNTAPQPWINSPKPADQHMFLPSTQSPMYQMVDAGGIGVQDQQIQQREPGFTPVQQQHPGGIQPQQAGIPFNYSQQWPSYYPQSIKPESANNGSDAARFIRPPGHHLSGSPYPGMQMASSGPGQQYGGTDGGYRESDGSQSSLPAGTSRSRHGDDGQLHGNGAPNGGGNAGGHAGKDNGKDGTPKKAVLACHFCRGRKLKCDGAKPTCSHCQRRNLTCSYDAVIRRRGPGKKKKGQPHDPSQGDISGEGSGDGGQPADEKATPEGKKRGRKPKDPNAPTKRPRAGDLDQTMHQPGLPPPHPGYAPYAGPPMHGYPPNHPYHHPHAYAPYPNAFHPGPPDSYIDPSLQPDRRMEYPPPHAMAPPDHRYDYPQHPAYISRPMPHDEEEAMAKRARYPNYPTLPDPSMSS